MLKQTNSQFGAAVFNGDSAHEFNNQLMKIVGLAYFLEGKLSENKPAVGEVISVAQQIREVAFCAAKSVKELSKSEL